MTPSKANPHSARNALLTFLRTTFPVFRENKPLAIGIHKVIKERLPDTDSQRLRYAMQMHTASTSYLKSLSNGTVRFDLDGNAVGEVTAEQSKQALDGLRERFRKVAEQRRAEQTALENQRIAEQRAQEQQKKLLQLAEKFNAR